ncbi:lipopolysaccharide biosynthesis protein [Patulibacter americanus]|uniref:lipopolysaccharide biosynthesis protein n=1 Tax=Patulibacter americanus TaxID=588672 RepID=UPI0003B4AAD5|nr:oligosaccharide flippase family protein [Patulibacter americanus]
MIARLRSPQVRAIIDGLGSSVLIQACVLISGIAAARLLGPGDRGNLALIWTVTLTLSQLGSLGLPLAVTKEAAQRDTDARALARELRRPVLVQIAVVSLVHAATVAALVSFTSLPPAAAWLSLVVLPPMLAQMFGLAVLQGLREFRTLNLLRTLPLALYAAALIALAVIGNPTLLAVTWAWIGSYAASAAVTIWVLVQCLQRAPAAATQNRRPDVASMRRFGLRGLLGWASPTETFRVDQLVVGLVLSSHSLGLYVAALAFTNFPRFVAQAVGLVAYPSVSRATSPVEKRTATLGFLGLGSLFSFVVCGGLAILAHPLVTIAFGQEFEAAAGPLRVLLIATFLLCVRRVLTDATRGAGFESAGSRAEMLSWLVLVPGFLVFAGPFGLYGVAWVLVGSYAVSAAVLGYLTLRPGGWAIDGPAASTTVP